MKLGLLILSKHHFAHIEDLAAVSSVFSVEFFNALFISMCMGMNMNWSKSSTTTTTTSSNSSSSNSSSNSWVTSSVMMAIDCLQMVASLWILTKKAKTLLQYIREQDSLKEEEVLIEEEKEEEEEEEGKKKKEIIRSSTSTKSHASLRHGRRRNTIEECLEFARKYQEAIKRNERDLRIQSSHGLKFERSRQVTHAITMGKEYFNRAVVSLKHTTLRRIDQIDEILPIEINQSFRSNSLRGKLLTMTTASTSTSTTNLTTKTTPLDRMLKTTNHSEIRPPRPFLSKATNAVMPTKDIATTVDGDTMVAPTHQFPSMAKKITKKIRGGGAQFFALIKDVEKYNTKVKILRETLSILYGLEHVILVEYVEAFIPFFYGKFSFSYNISCIHLANNNNNNNNNNNSDLFGGNF
jgi:guanyl-specific ribonuclease Sa